jgi:hypothetical protein
MFNRKAVDEKTFSPGGKGESAELKAGNRSEPAPRRFHAERPWFPLWPDLCPHHQGRHDLIETSVSTKVRRFLPCLTLELSNTKISAVS